MPRRKKPDLSNNLVRDRVTVMHEELFDFLAKHIEGTIASWPWDTAQRPHSMHGFSRNVYIDCAYGSNGHDLATLHFSVTTALTTETEDEQEVTDRFVDIVKPGRIANRDERAYNIGLVLRKRTNIETSVTMVNTDRDASAALAYAKRVEAVAFLGTTMEEMARRWLVPSLIGKPFVEAIERVIA